MALGNPIKSVNGIQIPCVPSKYEYLLQDVSSPDAGRTEDGTMDKERIGQCVKLELEWKYLSVQDCSTILKAFNDEYFDVEYLDAKYGMFITKNFYAGDRKSPLYNATQELWEGLAFNIIEKTCQKVSAVDVYYQPRNVSGSVGEDVSFTVRVDGKSLSYQWQHYYNGAWTNLNIEGYNTNTLHVECTESVNGRKYRCIITDTSGNSVTTDEATLTVE